MFFAGYSFQLSVSLWQYLRFPCFFFFRAVRLTGPFVTMIYSMITGDMVTFGCIYCIMLLAFSQALFFLHRNYPTLDPSSNMFPTYHSTWMGLFRWTLGDYEVRNLSLLYCIKLTTLQINNTLIYISLHFRCRKTLKCQPILILINVLFNSMQILRKPHILQSRPRCSLFS